MLEELDRRIVFIITLIIALSVYFYISEGGDITIFSQKKAGEDYTPQAPTVDEAPSQPQGGGEAVEEQQVELYELRVFRIKQTILNNKKIDYSYIVLKSPMPIKLAPSDVGVVFNGQDERVLKVKEIEKNGTYYYVIYFEVHNLKKKSTVEVFWDGEHYTFTAPVKIEYEEQEDSQEKQSHTGDEQGENKDSVITDNTNKNNNEIISNEDEEENSHETQIHAEPEIDNTNKNNEIHVGKEDDKHIQYKYTITAVTGLNTYVYDRPSNSQVHVETFFVVIKDITKIIKENGKEYSKEEYGIEYYNSNSISKPAYNVTYPKSTGIEPIRAEGISDVLYDIPQVRRETFKIGNSVKVKVVVVWRNKGNMMFKNTFSVNTMYSPMSKTILLDYNTEFRSYDTVFMLIDKYLFKITPNGVERVKFTDKTGVLTAFLFKDSQGNPILIWSDGDWTYYYKYSADLSRVITTGKIPGRLVRAGWTFFNVNLNSPEIFKIYVVVEDNNSQKTLLIDNEKDRIESGWYGALIPVELVYDVDLNRVREENPQVIDFSYYVLKAIIYSELIMKNSRDSQMFVIPVQHLSSSHTLFLIKANNNDYQVEKCDVWTIGDALCTTTFSKFDVNIMKLYKIKFFTDEEYFMDYIENIYKVDVSSLETVDFIDTEQLEELNKNFKTTIPSTVRAGARIQVEVDNKRLIKSVDYDGEYQPGLVTVRKTTEKITDVSYTISGFFAVLTNESTVYLFDDDLRQLKSITFIVVPRTIK